MLYVTADPTYAWKNDVIKKLPLRFYQIVQIDRLKFSPILGLMYCSPIR